MIRREERGRVTHCSLLGRDRALAALATARRLVEARGGYARVNQDTLKTLEKCEGAARAALRAGRAVVVDNTNRSAELRARWGALAAAAGVPCRCVHVATPPAVCRFLSASRRVRPQGAEEAAHEAVPDVALFSYARALEPPSAADEPALAEVHTLAFAPGPFASAAQEREFFRFV